MTYELLTKEVKRELNMAQQANQKLNVYAKCELLGKIGYLQGVYQVKASRTTNNTQKVSYNVILGHLGAFQKEVMA